MLIEIKDIKMANANSLCKLLAKEVCNYFYFILAKESVFGYEKEFTITVDFFKLGWDIIYNPNNNNEIDKDLRKISNHICEIYIRPVDDYNSILVTTAIGDFEDRIQLNVNDKEAKNINKVMNSIQSLIDRYKQ
ncbi:MAG: hypothetical protein WBI08_03950 [Bacteroidales bacterium]